METNKFYCGDSLKILKTMPDESVHCCVTSPPYWNLRDYKVDGQLGLEKTPEEYVSKLVRIFREVKRVLRNDGTLWLNLGDSYTGGGRGSGYSNKQDSNRGTVNMPRSITSDNLKNKDLIGIPWMVAFALRSDGWWLRQDIIWHKPNAIPESVTDRCTKTHEYVFLLSKLARYYYDYESIKETATKKPDKNPSKSKSKYPDTPEFRTKQGLITARLKDRTKTGRNKRSVWTVSTSPLKEAHFATFPEKLIIPMIKAGCPVNGIILDPFMGSGTTAFTAKKLNRNYIGIELNPEYIKIAEKRLAKPVQVDFSELAN